MSETTAHHQLFQGTLFITCDLLPHNIKHCINKCYNIVSVHRRANNFPWFCSWFPENKPFLWCSDEKFCQSPWLRKVVPCCVECNSKQLPEFLYKISLISRWKCWQLWQPTYRKYCLYTTRVLKLTHSLICKDCVGRSLWPPMPTSLVNTSKTFKSWE